MRFAYGPALIAVGVLMLESVKRIELDDLTELVPAFVTITMMVFTYNIANGLTAGLVLWPAMKMLSGRARSESGGDRARSPLPCLLHLWPAALTLI